jgi:L-methionine (R)-S-oxide reductase
MSSPSTPAPPGSPSSSSSPLLEKQAWLEGFLREHGGVAGTVHERLDDETLVLTAAVNIPPPVQDIVRRIPKGKGMAGLAFEHNEPISTCNIKDDATGRVRPGAKAVNAQAAVAFPIVDGAGAVRAVVGIAYQGERDIDKAELDTLTAAARTLP